MTVHTIKIPQINFQEHLIPEKVVQQGELYRIEVGISLGANRKQLTSTFYQICKEQKIPTINHLKNRRKVKYLFKSKTVGDYLSEQNIPQKLKEQLIKHCHFANLKRVNEQAKLNSLSEQEFRLIKIFVLLHYNRRVFIDTAGMYLAVLFGTYNILADFLESGGIVVELTYPHFGETDELQWMASKKISSFKVGEMKILK